MSKVLSVIIALVAAVAGYAALWQGSGTLLWVRGSFDAPASTTVPVLLVLLGSLLVAAAALTVRLSRLGPIVVGALSLAFSLALTLTPASSGGDATLLRLVLAWDSPPVLTIGSGAILTSYLGLLFVLGFAFLALGLFSRERPPGGAVARIVFALCAVAVIALTASVFWFGVGVYQTKLAVMTEAPLGQALQLVQAALIVAALVALRWSSIAALASGTVLTVVGLAGIFATVPGLPQPSYLILLSGSPAIAGICLLGVGFGALLRARRTPGQQAVAIQARPGVDGL